MSKLAAISLLLLPAAALVAQGPPRGPGFGPMAGRGMGVGRGMGMAVVTGAPYSAVETVQTQETLSDGNVISRKHQTNVFRDGLGRLRMEETVTPDASTGKQPFTVVTILDYVGGYRYELNSSTMTAHQSPLHVPRTQTAQPTTPHNPPQGVTTTLPAQTVNGVLATGTQYVQTIPAGAIGNAKPIQVTRVTWVANDLKVPVQIKSSDPRFGATDMELTNIVQAEPSATLFVVPAGYTTKTGGQGFRGQMRGPHGPPPAQQ